LFLKELPETAKEGFAFLQRRIGQGGGHGYTLPIRLY